MPAGVRPFRQFVIKVHSRCDLACDHCYVYRHPDQSWRGRPVTMSDETFRHTAARIAEHALAHGLPRVHVVLHGGEPLLAGRERLRGFARRLRTALGGACELDLRMQTNGLRLDEEFCAMLADESIVTGVSLDGDRAANDRHRIRADGSGSHARAVRGIRLLGAPAHRRAFGGLLCTIDVENDPVMVYRSLAALDPPAIDFLLPHATWDRPPPRPRGAAGYADWLIAVHRAWTADGRPVRIRMFESITRLAHGGISLTEALGLGSSDLLVVETDGAVEQADWLKTVAQGAPGTGFHVARDSFDLAAGHPGILAQRRGLDGLSAQCRDCPVVGVCGGGLYAHRFRTPPSAPAPTGSVSAARHPSATPRTPSFAPDAPPVPRAPSFAPAVTSEPCPAPDPSLSPDSRPAPRAPVLLPIPRIASGKPAAPPPGGFDNPSVYCADLLKLIRYATAAEAGSPAAALGMQPAHFDAVAAGRSGASAVRELVRAQHGLRRVLLAAAHRAAGADPARETAPGMRAVLGLSPAALDIALTDPFLRPWALAVCESGPPDPGRPAEIALSAAARAGEPLTLTVPPRDGTVQLPGLGRLVLAGSPPPAPVIAAADGRLTVDGRGLGELAPGVRWEPLRHLEADGLRVALEDTDPYREAGAPRLDEAGHRRWQRLLRRAWQVIRTRHAHRAEGIAAGLRALTPVAGPPGQPPGRASRHTFGVIATALPASPEEFALLLIREFRRSELLALQDLYDLLGPGGGRHRVAWRTAPQPLDTILHETCAALAVAGVWADRSGPWAGSGGAEAARLAASWRTAVLGALDVLETEGAPTALGSRLLTGMRAEARALGPSG
ncbi:FxsB family cyclophane-forming radical SAM/SPASM peptide maturase [Streptomyces sp. CAU 1734]|uniref:FxsB family cyclophane-forming radical SAM/SPASM peptide maturase n=1 Tax=Streptomyces sp. CAU 1734 TaxID=3140360 RepID=UPI003261581D